MVVSVGGFPGSSTGTLSGENGGAVCVCVCVCETEGGRVGVLYLSKQQ